MNEGCVATSVITETAMRARLRQLCQASSQRAVAKRWHYSPSFIGDVLSGRRAMTRTLAERMGYQRVAVFRVAGGAAGITSQGVET